MNCELEMGIRAGEVGLATKIRRNYAFGDVVWPTQAMPCV